MTTFEELGNFSEDRSSTDGSFLVQLLEFDEKL